MSVPNRIAPKTTPYHLELGLGSTELDLGVDNQIYSGTHFSVRVGQSFPLSPRQSGFIHGVFNLASLRNAESNSLNAVHYGMDAGYELTLSPDTLSLGLSLGLGTNMFYSDNFSGALPGLSVDNQASVAFTAGASLRLFRGILVASAGWQPNFGLQAKDPNSDVNPPTGYNPRIRYFNVAVNVAALTHALGKSLPGSETLGEWAKEIKPGVIADASYTANLQNPVDEKNALRVFDQKTGFTPNAIDLSLDRPSSEEHPFGARADLVIGEDAAIAAPRHSFRPPYSYIQQLYATLRLPIHKGVTVKAGHFATPIGAEVLEGPLNNQISRGNLFFYTIPATHSGITVDGALTESTSALAGVVRSWDNVAGSDGGLTALGALTTVWNDKTSTMLAGTYGQESGHRRGLLHLLTTYKPQGSEGPSTLQLECDIGHETGDSEVAAASWKACSALGRYNEVAPELSVSARVEVLSDPQGARTGTSQILGGATATLHYEPAARWKFRAEYRHDFSSEDVFLHGAQPALTQDTLAFGAAYVY